jgi:branched-chain amino acid transport system ATP-binding protein
MTVATSDLLAVTNLEVVYQRTVRAVQGVSFRVPDASITAIVGANGAGKSTTLAAIAGHLSTDDVEITQGEIAVDGRPCRGLSPHVISRRGVALVPERGKIFARLTVQENFRAARPRKAGGSAVSPDDVLDIFPRLRGVLGRTAGYLSGGERQMLAIGMGLLNAPRILLIDEFSLGLAPAAVDELIHALRQIRTDLDLALLVVEQSAGVAVRLADYVYVMEGGRMVFEGASDRVVENEDFREFYLGISTGEHERSYRDVKQYEKKKRWFG